MTVFCYLNEDYLKIQRNAKTEASIERTIRLKTQLIASFRRMQNL